MSEHPHRNDTESSDRPTLDDEVLPTRHLLGEGAIDVLTAAYESSGLTVVSAVPTQTTYHPRRSLTVLHEVRLRAADGSMTTERVGLAVGRSTPKGATVLSDGDHNLIVWQVPADPWLPGFAPAMRPADIAPVLASLDLTAPTVNTRLRAYRPGRRAVIEAYGSGMRAFVKVVKPSAAEALHHRHVLLADSLSVPHSLGWTADHGLVVLQALPGRTLRQVLLSGLPLPGPAALTAVLDSLPDPTEVVGDATAPTVNWRAHEFAEFICSVAPDLAERVRALAERLDRFEQLAADEPIVAVHGDFYEAQLLVDRAAITGVLDVDTFGFGRRVDDLATMVGHLVTLAIGSPNRTSIERYALRLLDGFDREVDPALLRAAIAGIVLGLATGPFRVLEPRWHHHTENRIACAETWIESAERVAAARRGHLGAA